MKFSSVTFDLDGTLLDTVLDLTEACQRMLDELRLPQRSEAEVRDFVGQGMVVLVRRCLARDVPPDEALTSRAVSVFQRHYAAVNGTRTQLFPGVAEGLDAWAGSGLPLAVVTNKPAAFTEPLLERVGLRHYFQTVISGDTTAQRKPHPEPLLEACRRMGVAAQANLHIGDSRHDIETARRAGCAAVYGVTYGYNEGAALRPEDCDALVEDLRMTLALATVHRP